MKEKRIELKTLEKKDIPDLFLLTSDDKVARFMRFDTHKTIKEAEELWSEYVREGNFAYRVCLSDTEEMVGIAALKKDEEKYNISIFSFPKYWNQGYSTEIVEKLKEIAIKNGIKELHSYVVAENIASRKIMEKTGFSIKEVWHFDDTKEGLYHYWLKK